MQSEMFYFLWDFATLCQISIPNLLSELYVRIYIDYIGNFPCIKVYFLKSNGRFIVNWAIENIIISTSDLIASTKLWPISLYSFMNSSFMSFRTTL